MGDHVERTGRDEDVVTGRGGPGPGSRRAWRRRADRGHRPALAIAPVDVGRARGQHRQHRAAHLEPDSRPARPRRRSSAAPATATVEPASIAERRTARSGMPVVDASGLLDQRVERTLPQLAGHQPAQPPLLVCGGTPEQLGHRRGARRLRAGAGQGGDPGEGVVDLDQGQDGLGRGLGQLLQAAPAEAGAPLQQRPAEVGDQDLGLVGGLGPEPAEQARQRHHLGLARAGGGHGGGGGDDIGEQHVAIVSGATHTPDRSAGSGSVRVGSGGGGDRLRRLEHGRGHRPPDHLLEDGVELGDTPEVAAGLERDEAV